MTKLHLRRVDAPAVTGGSAYALHDEAGEMLPNQTAIRIDQSTMKPSEVTVTFMIDGDAVRVA